MLHSKNILKRMAYLNEENASISIDMNGLKMGA